MSSDTPNQEDAQTNADSSSPMAFVLDVHAIACTLLEREGDPKLSLSAIFDDLRAIRSGAEELINAAEDPDPEESDLRPRTVTMTLRRETVQVETQAVTFTLSHPEDLKLLCETRRPPYTRREHCWFISQKAETEASATGWTEVDRRVMKRDPTDADIVINPSFDED